MSQQTAAILLKTEPSQTSSPSTIIRPISNAPNVHIQNAAVRDSFQFSVIASIPFDSQVPLIQERKALAAPEVVEISSMNYLSTDIGHAELKDEPFVDITFNNMRFHVQPHLDKECTSVQLYKMLDTVFTRLI